MCQSHTYSLNKETSTTQRSSHGTYNRFSLIYCNEHRTLTNKPVVEKLRRDRINNRIGQLKSLLGPEILTQQPDSKLEKADILEMTLCFLRRQQQNQPVSSCLAPVNQGYSRCVQEIVHFLSKDEVKTQSQRRLLSHFQSLHPSSDKNRRESDLPQLSSPAQHSISKENNPVNSTLWRPWKSPTDWRSTLNQTQWNMLV
ncbi:transcription factor HES-5-like [Coregonus clupeaformis]|uniref:transcription factor HES-5-like n=1 Tax=Coregonus clupeaformis TaxID=59861 RepID=UPI001E1C76B8|nr:transcription factor HES-5-like [Coregonus clupeaformis]